MFEEYSVMIFEICRIFIFLITDSESGDGLTVSPFVNSLLLKCRDRLAKATNGPGYTQMGDFVDDVKLKLGVKSKIPLSDEVRLFLATDKDQKAEKALTLYFTNLLNSKTDNKKNLHLVSIFRKTMQNHDKNHKIVGMESCDNLKSAASEIKSQSYYLNMTEEEFQNLIYRGKDTEQKAKFQNFLVGIISYLHPSQGAEKRIVIFGLNFIRNYLDLRDSNIHQSEQRERRHYLLSCRLDRLLCSMVALSDDVEVLFHALETANQLVKDLGTEHKNGIINTIYEIDSFQFINRPLDLVKSYLHNLEKQMARENSNNLLKQLFGFSQADAVAETINTEEILKRIVTFYTFLSLLCKGHNKKTQAFLTKQEQADQHGRPVRSIDILQEACEHLKTATRFINKHSVPVVIQILELLAASTAGPCKENQDLVLSYRIVDIVKDLLVEVTPQDNLSLLVKGFAVDDRHGRKMLDLCYVKAILLLAALVEGNPSKTLLEDIAGVVRFESLIAKLEAAFDQFSAKYSASRRLEPGELSSFGIASLSLTPVFDAEAQTAFDLFFLLRTIIDHSDLYSEDIQELSGKQKMVFEFFDANTVSIEANFRGTVQKLFFCKYPACDYFSPHSMENFMNSVKRDSPNQKVADFVQASAVMFNEMDYTFRLKKQFKVDPAYSRYLRVLALVICYVQNFYLLVFAGFKVVYQVQEDDKSTYSEPFFRALAVVYLVVIGLAIVLYYMDTVNISRINKWNDFIRRLKYINNLTTKETEWINSYLDRSIFNLTNADYYALIRFMKAKEGNDRPLPRLTKLAYDIKFLDSQLFVLGFYFLCYLGGLLTNDYLMFSLPLLDTVVDSSD